MCYVHQHRHGNAHVITTPLCGHTFTVYLRAGPCPDREDDINAKATYSASLVLVWLKVRNVGVKDEECRG